MDPFAQKVTVFISTGVLVMSILIVCALIALIFFRKNRTGQTFLSLISKNSLIIGFVVSLAGILVSLYYSNIVGFPPCEFCWWARIFMYPQAFMFGIALWRKKKNKDFGAVFTESLVLSVIGGLIMLYDYYGQSFNPGILAACGAVGASCAKVYFTSFGFITIPFMALAGFIALILNAVIYKTSKSE
jgi:disulfide bond formation protein DsbB